jgi:hypothetical protein
MEAKVLDYYMEKFKGLIQDLEDEIYDEAYNDGYEDGEDDALAEKPNE